MDIWKEDVVRAFENLGGTASLNQAYREVKNIRKAENRDWPKNTDAIIRRTIQQYSSDTTSYRKEEDLFKTVNGLGKGIWALRNAPPVPIEDLKHSFVVGQLYNRQKDIHDRYGGSRRSGICPSADYPYVFIFTGGSGENYGYSDKWENGVFNYFGEGQEGDMTFTNGNKAILEHSSDGKDLLLFKASGKGDPVRFLGEFICESFEEITAKDKNDADRKAIVFQLRPAEFGNEEQDPHKKTSNTNLSLQELRNRAYAAASSRPQSKTRTSSTTVRERKEEIKAWALKRADGVCECCGAPAPFRDKNGEPFLEVHHITRLSDNGIDNPLNVAAITPNCHRKIHNSIEGAQINARLLEVILQKEGEYDGKL